MKTQVKLFYPTLSDDVDWLVNKWMKEMFEQHKENFNVIDVKFSGIYSQEGGNIYLLVIYVLQNL